MATNEGHSNWDLGFESSPLGDEKMKDILVDQYQDEDENKYEGMSNFQGSLELPFKLVDKAILVLIVKIQAFVKARTFEFKKLTLI